VKYGCRGTMLPPMTIRLASTAAEVVCAENPVRIDLMAESPNVIGDDRADMFLDGVAHCAIQIEEPA